MPKKLKCSEHKRCTPRILNDGTEVHHTQVSQTQDIFGKTGSTERECDNCQKSIKPGEWVFEYYNAWTREDGTTEVDPIPVTLCKECESDAL